MKADEIYGGRAMPREITKTNMLFSLYCDTCSTQITEEMQIRYDGKDYDIQSIEDVEQRGRELKIVGELIE